MENMHRFQKKGGGFPGSLGGKISTCNVGDPGSIPESGRSPGEWNGNPLQCSCLENPMDGEAWEAAVHGVAKSRTQLSNFTFTFHKKSTNRLIIGPSNPTPGHISRQKYPSKRYMHQYSCIHHSSWQPRQGNNLRVLWQVTGSRIWGTYTQ